MIHSRILLEEIVASLDDAVRAAEGGADRFELCSALGLGGLTPSLGTVREIKQNIEVPAMCMVRPREGGMAYSDGEFKAMITDLELFLDAGADGIVFGLLTDGGEVDIRRSREFLKRIEEGARPVQTVFHRAFDVVAHPDTALEQLVDLGVTRILTSGRAATAFEALGEIRRYVELADGRIEILPGGTIKLSHLDELVRATGVDQVHLYLTRIEEDRSTLQNPEVYFGAHVSHSETGVHRVDPEGVRRAREILDR